MVTGSLPKVGGVSQHTKAILHKLNFGEKTDKHNWDGKESMKSFEGANYVARNFVDEGYNISKGAMLEAMTNRYEKLLHSAVNRTNVVAVERRSS